MEARRMYLFELTEDEQTALIEAHRILREVCNTVGDCKECPLVTEKEGRHYCASTSFTKVVSSLTDY